MIAGLSPLDSLFGSQRANPAASAVAPAAVDFGASFGSALAGAASRATETLRGAEAVSLKAIQGGEVPTREVVDAVMSAEQALQTSIAIRDKIVSAWLEVSRMQI